MTWGRVAHPSEMVKIGDTIAVKVLSFDKNNEKISLGLKQLQTNPWDKISEGLAVGQKIKGKVSSITDYGLFVEVAPEVEGLVHISEVSWTEHIEHPSDRYKIGQEVEAVILSIDKDNKKISLGIKQLSNDPWETVAEQHPVGSIVDGEISKITNFGAFVKLPNNIEGLMHNTILTQEQSKKAEEFFTVGQKAQFRIININKEERKLAFI